MRKKIYTKMLNVLISDEMFKTIRQITDQEEVSISSWIRDAVQMRIDKDDLEQSFVDENISKDQLEF